MAARPLLTPAITTSILFGVGDIASQQLVEKRGIEKHEFARTGRMLLYGGSTFPSSSSPDHFSSFSLFPNSGFFIFIFFFSGLYTKLGQKK
jgi:hypothetical protein